MRISNCYALQERLAADVDCLLRLPAMCVCLTTRKNDLPAAPVVALASQTDKKKKKEKKTDISFDGGVHVLAVFTDFSLRIYNQYQKASSRDALRVALDSLAVYSCRGRSMAGDEKNKVPATFTVELLIIANVGYWTQVQLSISLNRLKLRHVSPNPPRHLGLCTLV